VAEQDKHFWSAEANGIIAAIRSPLRIESMHE